MRGSIQRGNAAGTPTFRARGRTPQRASWQARAVWVSGACGPLDGFDRDLGRDDEPLAVVAVFLEELISPIVAELKPVVWPPFAALKIIGSV